MSGQPTAGPTATDRALGIAGIVGGLVLDAAFVPNLPWTADIFNLRLTLLNIGAIAVAIGVVRLQWLTAPRVALLAAVLVVLANAWHLILIVQAVGREGQIGPGDYGPTYNVAAGAMWLSGAVFGVTSLRLGGIARWAAAALAVGSGLAFLPIIGLTGEAYAGRFDAFILAGVALYGLGWIGLGVSLVIGPLAAEADGRPSVEARSDSGA